MSQHNAAPKLSPQNADKKVLFRLMQSQAHCASCFEEMHEYIYHGKTPAVQIFLVETTPGLFATNSQL